MALLTELNHASVIDGIRLCKAQRYRYRNNDMTYLEAKLEEGRRACGPNSQPGNAEGQS